MNNNAIKYLREKIEKGIIIIHEGIITNEETTFYIIILKSIKSK